MGGAVNWRGECLARPLAIETSSGGGQAALVAAGAPQLTWQWPLDPSDGETNRGSLTATGECLARPWAGEGSRGGTTALARCPPRPSAVGSPPQRCLASLLAGEAGSGNLGVVAGGLPGPGPLVWGC